MASAVAAMMRVAITFEPASASELASVVDYVLGEIERIETIFPAPMTSGHWPSLSSFAPSFGRFRQSSGRPTQRYHFEPIPGHLSTPSGSSDNNINDNDSQQAAASSSSNNNDNNDNDNDQQAVQQPPQSPQSPHTSKVLAVPGFFHPPSRNTAVLGWSVDQARHHEGYSQLPNFFYEKDGSNSPGSPAVAGLVGSGEVVGDDGHAVVDTSYHATADVSTAFSDFDDLQDAEGEDDVDLINVGNNGPGGGQGDTSGEWTLIEKDDGV